MCLIKQAEAEAGYRHRGASLNGSIAALKTTSTVLNASLSVLLFSVGKSDWTQDAAYLRFQIYWISLFSYI